MERKVYEMEKKQNEMQIEIDQIALPEVPKIQSQQSGNSIQTD